MMLDMSRDMLDEAKQLIEEATNTYKVRIITMVQQCMDEIGKRFCET